MDNNVEQAGQAASTVGGSFTGQITVGPSTSNSSTGNYTVLIDGNNRRIVLSNGSVPAISLDQYGLYFGQTPPSSSSSFWVDASTGNVYANGLDLTGFLTSGGVGQIVSGSIIAGSASGSNIAINGSDGSITFQSSTGGLAGSIYGQDFEGDSVLYLNGDVITENLHTMDITGDSSAGYPASISDFDLISSGTGEFGTIVVSIVAHLFGVDITGTPPIITIPDADPVLALISTPSNSPGTFFTGAVRYYPLAALPLPVDGTLAYLYVNVESPGSIKGLYFYKAGSGWILVA
jgi:hypothetical protein